MESPCWTVNFAYPCPNGGGKLWLFPPSHGFIYTCLVGLDQGRPWAPEAGTFDN